MAHATARRLFGLALLAGMLTLACGGSEFPDLSPEAAAAGLRSSPNFTTRPGSAVGRELIEVLAVRRIGRSSTEVEFTWRDTPAAPGQVVTTVKTSMALFRVRDDGTWGLSSLYKVN
jgi:hypothetical protein